jgi:glucokinase
MQQSTNVNFRTGVDIGGSHITAALVNLDSGQLIEESYVRHHLDPSGTKDEIIDTWAETIKACNRNYSENIFPVSLAMPGPFDYEEGVSLITGLHKFESLYGLNVKELLAASLHIDPGMIQMNNDAICYLAGERKAGAVKDESYVAGLTLGTGLGSAIYRNEEYQAGDLYRMSFRNSRAEEFLCSRWFISEYKRRSNKDCSGAKELASIISHDKIAQQIFEDFGTTLAEVLIEKFGDDFPGKIVVGGNIAKAWDLFYPHTERRLNPYHTSLVPAQLGENAALVGAASLLH